jgi:hypothetical protein
MAEFDWLHIQSKVSDEDRIIDFQTRDLVNIGSGYLRHFKIVDDKIYCLYMCEECRRDYGVYHLFDDIVDCEILAYNYVDGLRVEIILKVVNGLVVEYSQPGGDL